MKRRRWMIGIVMCVAIGMGRVWAAQARVGAVAPDFTLTDSAGQPQTLAQHRGHFVVLEWFNPDCPFTKKHYVSMNMQRLQATYALKGVVWLSIDSSALGKQGHLTPKQAQAFVQQQHMAATAALLDPDGAVGRLYGAKTTPHMFIIDPKGILIYAGAIDDRPSADPKDANDARNYVQRALDEAMAGAPVSIAETTPYGCSVKY